MNRKLALIASAVALFSSTAFSANDFSLFDISLGDSLNDVSIRMQEVCPDCMTYNGGGAAGTFSTTVYLRYSTVYFSNTRSTEVDRSKPFESVTYTFSPDKKVISIGSAMYGSKPAASKFYEQASTHYHGELQSFTQPVPGGLLFTTQADLSTNHLFNFYDVGLTGKKFQLSTWPEGLLFSARVTYTDFDAVREIEKANPAKFRDDRMIAGVGYLQDGSVSIKPREVSSIEAPGRAEFKPVTNEYVLKFVHGSDVIEVVPEILDGDDHPPSQLIVNGTVVAKGSLRQDGMTFGWVQPLDAANGLYRVDVTSHGNSCSAQGVHLLRVVDGKGYLSESFGRCNGAVTSNNGTFYFSFDATEYEPALTLAVP